MPAAAEPARNGAPTIAVRGNLPFGRLATEWATSTAPQITCSCCRSSRPSEELPSWTLTRRRPAAPASTSRAHGSMKSRCVPWAGGM